MPTPPTLLVSWSHTEPDWSGAQSDRRRDAVLRLANNLRNSGIDAQLDLHQSGGTADWSRWGPDKVESSDFVLIIGSPAWNRAWQGNGDLTRGAGAAAEADALKSLYNRDRAAFLAKVRLAFLPGTPNELPLGLDGIERYYLTDDTPGALSKLIRDLSDQPAFPPGPLGTLPDLPPDDSWRTSTPAPSPAAPHPARPTATPSANAELQYTPLSGSITVRWREEWTRRDQSSQTMIAVHVLNTQPTSISGRRLATLSEDIVRQLRGTGLFDDGGALDKSDNADSVTVTAPREERYMHGQVRPGRLEGVRIDRSGQVSAWHSLPTDGLGAAIDHPSAAAAITDCLVLAGATGAAPGDNVAIAVELGPISMLSQVDVATLGHRNSASMGSFGASDIRMEPDELVEARALRDGAGEAAQTLAQLLLRAWGQRR